MTHNTPPAPRRASDAATAGDAGQGTQRPGSSTATAKPKSAPVSPIVARQIDENLKRLYHQQVEQDLPPALQDLVARLRGGHDGPAPRNGDDEETA